MALSRWNGFPVINDETRLEHAAPPDGRGTGFRMAYRGPNPYAGLASPFPKELFIPRSEWQARIQEREQKKARLIDLCDRWNLPVEDQKQTNYCWAFATCHAATIVGWKQGDSRGIRLSPVSVAARVKNFRNVGGWGPEALEELTTHGCNTLQEWDNAVIDRRFDTPENREKAKLNIIDEWWELPQDDTWLDALVTCQLLGLPASAGFGWWGHQVCLMDPAWIDGAIAEIFDNSWSPDWGNKGRGVLQGSRMRPDDAVVCRVRRVRNAA